MRNGKGRYAMRLTAALVSLLTLLGLNGCGKAPATGGVTDKTDPEAPKTIASKDIAEFHASFCLGGEWSPGRETVFYTFDISPDAAGTPTASESVTGVSAAADGALLRALQEIIDAEGLAERNGKDRVTAGLPPDRGPCTLSVRYASGETLSFRHNNDPLAGWAKKMYLAFAEWFASQGQDALLPPQTVEGGVTDVLILFRDGGDSYYYGVEPQPGDAGQNALVRSLNGREERAPLADEAGFLAGIDRIIAGFDLRPYDTASALYGYEETEADRASPFSAALQFTLRFGDDRQISVHSSAGRTIADLAPLRGSLFDYFDSFFPGEQEAATTAARRDVSEDLLLIVDFQNVYLPGYDWACASMPRAMENTRRLLDAANAPDFVMTKYVAPAAPFGRWAQYNEAYREINENAFLSEFPGEMAPYAPKAAAVIEKSTYSSMDPDAVRAVLAGKKAVVLAGVTAECCVLATMMDAIDLGYEVVYLYDCIAGQTEALEEQVRGIAEVFAPVHTAVMSVDEYLAAIS